MNGKWDLVWLEDLAENTGKSWDEFWDPTSSIYSTIIYSNILMEIIFFFPGTFTDQQTHPGKF
jgi:hypothetical protein